MVRTLFLIGGLIALGGCADGGDDDLQSTPLDEPTREFEIPPPDVDTGWPLDTDEMDTDMGDTDDTDMGDTDDTDMGDTDDTDTDDTDMMDET